MNERTKTREGEGTVSIMGDDEAERKEGGRRSGRGKYLVVWALADSYQDRYLIDILVPVQTHSGRFGVCGRASGRAKWSKKQT